MHAKPHISNMATLVRQRVRYLIDHGAETESAFAATVREHYEETVAPNQRTVEWSGTRDPADRMKADADKLFGMLKNTIRRRLPVELLESVIAAMPAAARYGLQVELAERQGLLAVPMPQHGPGADAEALGRLSKEIGDVFTKFGSILGDGVIDINDAKLAPEAIREIEEAIGVLHELREGLITKALGGVDNVVPMGVAK